MDLVTEIFSHLCGQGRCFVSDGAALPLCQRCLGLYLGAGLTAAWLGASGLWRRGLPSRSVFAVQAAALLAAMVGGLHLLDPGPAWRAACGLWTGHVAVAWLIGGAVHLRRLRRSETQLHWRRGDKLSAIAAVALLAALAAALPQATRAGWWAWSAAAVVGAAVLALAAAAAAASVAAHAVWRLSPAAPGPRPG